MTACVVLAVLIVPLAADRYQMRMYQPVKRDWLVLLGGAALVGGAAAMLRLRARRRHVRAQPLFWAAAAVFAAITASTLLSLSPLLSVCNDQNHRHGWAAWAGYAGIFLAVMAMPARARRTLRRALALAVVLVSVWVMLEKITLPGSRPLGPLGHPQYTGEWLMLACFLVSAIPQRGAIVPLALVALALTGARAAWLGAAFGGLFAGAAWLTAHGKRKTATGLVLGTAAAGAIFVILSASGLVDTEAPLAGRLVRMFSSENRSAQIRLAVWGDTVEMIRDQPLHGAHRLLFGYGLETMKLVYGPYLSDALSPVIDADYEIPDRAHSLMLDTWRDTGLVGLAALVMVYVMGIWQGLRRMGRVDMPVWGGLALAGAAVGAVGVGAVYGAAGVWPGIWIGFAFGTVGYLLMRPMRNGNMKAVGPVAGLLAQTVTAQFTFLTAPTGLLLWVCIALMLPPPRGELGTARPKESILFALAATALSALFLAPPGSVWLMLHIVMGTVLILIYLRRHRVAKATGAALVVLGVWMARDVQAERLLRGAFDLVLKAPATVQRDRIVSAIDLTPHKSFWYLLAAQYSTAAGEYTQAVEWLNRGWALEPLDPIFPMERAAVYAAQMRGGAPADREALAMRADHDFQAAIAMTPRRPRAWTAWAEFLIALPEPTRAHAVASAAVEVAPRDRTAWIVMGEAALLASRLDEAERAFRRSIAIDECNHVRQYVGLAQVYKQRGEWARACDAYNNTRCVVAPGSWWDREIDRLMASMRCGELP